MCQALAMFLALSFNALPFGALVPRANAQEPDVHIEIRPYCQKEEKKESGGFGGPLPTADQMVNLGSGRCPGFEILDPQTRQTPVLAPGDIVDIEVVIKNIPTQPISRVRAWINYDPKILTGMSLDVSPDFSLLTPGENAFDPIDGYIKIHASTEVGEESDARDLVVARIQMKVLDTDVGRTVLSFYDYKTGTDGHTLVSSTAFGDEVNILSPEIGSLIVLLIGGAVSSGNDSSTTSGGLRDDNGSIEGSNGTKTDPSDTRGATPNTQGGKSTGNDSPPTATTSMNTGSDAPGGSMKADSNRLSPQGNGSNSSQAGGSLQKDTSTPPPFPPLPSSSGAPSPPPSIPSPRTPPPTTQFGTYQVQGMRVTTEGRSAFLTFDPLLSREIIGYNVYYGTVSGEYIHRKSIGKDETSLTLRDLPDGVTYYFAVRAVSSLNEESAYNQEVKVTIGQPDSSSSPLIARVGRGPAMTPHTSGRISGETGASSTLHFLFIIAGIIGTAMAFRRQMTLSPPSNIRLDAIS
jgi:hypothetical protein